MQSSDALAKTVVEIFVKVENFLCDVFCREQMKNTKRDSSLRSE